MTAPSLQGSGVVSMAFRMRSATIPASRIPVSGKTSDELLAAVTGDHVDLARHLSGRVGDHPQRDVAHLVPVRVVDVLEGIDVVEAKGQIVAVAVGALGLHFGRLEEMPPVVQSGERIGDRKPAETLLAFPQGRLDGLPLLDLGRKILVRPVERLYRHGQMGHHRVEGLGKLPQEIHLLGEISPGDHLGLPGEMFQAGLKVLHHARQESPGVQGPGEIAPAEGKQGVPQRDHVGVEFRKTLDPRQLHGQVAGEGFRMDVLPEEDGQARVVVALDVVGHEPVASALKRQVRSPVHQQSISFTVNFRPEKPSSSPAMNPSSYTQTS